MEKERGFVGFFGENTAAVWRGRSRAGTVALSFLCNALTILLSLGHVSWLCSLVVQSLGVPMLYQGLHVLTTTATVETSHHWSPDQAIFSFVTIPCSFWGFVSASMERQQFREEHN